MEMRNKQYQTNGLLYMKDRIYPDLPMTVTVTNDKLGYTVSLACEPIGMQFTVPFDRMLKDLEAK